MQAVTATVLLVLAGWCQGQSSPCPNVLKYEPPGEETDRWYGVISITTDSTIASLWLNIVLDGKAQLFGNWDGDVTSSNNKEFKIENTKKKIYPGSPTEIRFFVKYDYYSKIPRVTEIRLNGREICNIKIGQRTHENQDLGNNKTTTIVSPDWETPSIPNPILNRPSNEKPLPIPSQSPPIGQLVELDRWPEHVLPALNSQNSTASDDVDQGECGKVSTSGDRVFNGESTVEGEWPWQVALFRKKQGGNNFICGGTLVSRKHVVTAAHCVTHERTDRVVDTNTLTVYLGKHNLRTSVEGVQSRYVAEIIVHPQYRAFPFHQDLGILKLQWPVEVTEYVRPACLWPGDLMDLSYVTGKIGFVVGWGLNENGFANEELKLARMPVVPQQTCNDSDTKFFGKFTSDTTYCAGYRKGSTVCKGDSGSGMVLQMQGIWYLRGLVSLAKPHVIDGCDPSNYVVFTDLAQFLPWIKEIMHFTN